MASMTEAHSSASMASQAAFGNTYENRRTDNIVVFSPCRFHSSRSRQKQERIDTRE
jgi:hypothetical protein